jgi:hypothetical protein
MKIIERIRSLCTVTSHYNIALSFFEKNIKFRGKNPTSSTIKNIIFRFDTDLKAGTNTYKA